MAQGKLANYRVTLEGPEVEWAHRDSPEFWERRPGDNGPDDPGKPRKVVKPGIRVVLTEKVESKEHATALALGQNAHDGYVKVLGVEKA